MTRRHTNHLRDLVPGADRPPAPDRFCLAAADVGAVARPYEARPDRQSDALPALNHRMPLQIVIACDTRRDPALVPEDVR